MTGATLRRVREADPGRADLHHCCASLQTDTWRTRCGSGRRLRKSDALRRPRRPLFGPPSIRRRWQRERADFRPVAFVHVRCGLP